MFGELQSHFRPEFLNRVDDIVMFKPLARAEIERIVDLHARRAAQPAGRAAHQPRGHRPRHADTSPAGIRPTTAPGRCAAIIAREVETKIGRALLADAIPDQSTIRLDITDGDLVVTYHAAQVHA